MKRFVEGLGHGHQSTLFPETLEEFVAEDNAIRLSRPQNRQARSTH